MSGAVSGNLAKMSNRRFALLFMFAILIPISILAVAALLFPYEVWDNFLYPYFWGPIISDAQEHTVGGVPEGYNLWSTLVYAILLLLAFLAMYLVAKRVRLNVDPRFILATIPILAFGGLARALEDAQLFDGWLQYLFISPLIYVLVGSFFVLAVALGLVLQRRLKRLDIVRRTLVFSLLPVLLLTSYISMILVAPELLSAQLPWLLPIIFAISSILIFHYCALKRLDAVPATVLSLGLFLFLMALSFVVLFQFDQEWRAIFTLNTGNIPVTRPSELVVILGIALAMTTALFIAGKALKNGRLALLAAPVNLFLFFSQFLDGAATYRGIEMYGYWEKHVFPTFLINLTGTAAIMLLIKLVIVLAVVLVIDILYKEELKRYLNLGNIIKFGIIFLGVSPGVRDTVRIVLGV